MSDGMFGLGDSVEARHASCMKWHRGIVKAGRNEFSTFLVQFDHGEQRWVARDKMRHCNKAPERQT